MHSYSKFILYIQPKNCQREYFWVENKMTAFGCFLWLLTIENAVSQVFHAIMILLVSIAWISAFTFIYCLMKHQASSNVAKTEKKKFDCLMIVTVLFLSISGTLLFVTVVIQVHFRWPARAADDNTPCNNVDFAYEYWLLTFSFAIIGSVSYILIVSVYYYRLFLTFSNTLYEISQKRKHIFKFALFLCIICCITAVIDGIFQIAQKALLFMSFLLVIYVIESLRLCYILKSQLMLLIKSFDQNSNNSNNTNVNHQSAKMASQFFSIMKRFTILTYFSTVSTACLIVLMMVNVALFPDSKVFHLIGTMFAMIDMNIGITCVAVQFTFGDCIYNKICKHFEKLNIFRQNEHLINVGLELIQHK